MIRTIEIQIIIASFVVLGIGAVQPAAAGDDETRLECESALGTEDASMDAEFRDGGDRLKFSAEFEAAQGGSFAPGDILQVKVDGETVGTIELVLDVDVRGELNFDTEAQADDDDEPFPAFFPAISPGTIVEVGAQLACDMQE